MESKLFGKLNKTLEINSIKAKPLTEAEKCEIEHKLIFQDYSKNMNEDLKQE